VTDEPVATSRFLSYVLRHHPEQIGIVLDTSGWVDIETLLAASSAHGRVIDRAVLDRLVAGTDKRRFEVRHNRIRAAQGHSVPVDLQLPPIVPPASLFHGTVERFLSRILADGLVPKDRSHVHLSGDVATAATVGARRGEPIVLRVAAGEMHAHGHMFMRAANGVWLTAHVPAKWLTVTDQPRGSTAIERF
jgi:putative RNA 2'-phosphotransferase